MLPATYRLTYIIYILIYIYSLMQNHFSKKKKKKKIAMQNYFLTYVEIYILTYIYIQPYILIYIYTDLYI